MTNVVATDGRRWAFVYLAWVIALVASLGALFIGEVVGQTPCSLCWHQRAFMFPLAIMLALAAFRGDDGIWRYAVPLAAAGVLISGFHSLLYAGLIPAGIEPCTQGVSCTNAEMTIWGVLPLPFLALGAFSAIAIALLASRSGATP